MTSKTVRHLRQKQAVKAPAVPAERAGIYFNRELGDKILRAVGAKTVRKRASELGLSVGTIQKLWASDEPVSITVELAFALRFPEVSREQLFPARLGVPSHVDPESVGAAA